MYGRIDELVLDARTRPYNYERVRALSRVLCTFYQPYFSYYSFLVGYILSICFG